MHVNRTAWPIVLAFLAASASDALRGQARAEPVEVILSLPPAAADAIADIRPAPIYGLLEQHAGGAARTVLPLTRSEAWSLPAANVPALKAAAAEHGVAVTELGPDWRQLFRLASADMILSEPQRSLLNLAKASSSTIAMSTMQAPPAPIVEHALTRDADGVNRVGVTLADGTVLTMTRTSLTVTASLVIWQGRGDHSGAQVTAMWWPDNKITGTVRHGDRIFRIKHMGGAQVALIEMSEQHMPSEHAPLPPARRAEDRNVRDARVVQPAAGAAGQEAPAIDLFALARHPWSKLREGSAAGSPQLASLARPRFPASVGVATSSAAAGKAEAVIDVIVAYTRKIADQYADVARDLIDLAILEANDSFARSGIGQVKLRLAHAYQTDYVEQGSHFDHVWRFADKGDGHMEEIHALRDRYKADVAVLIVDDPAGCGLATRVYADAEDAFAVVHHECAAATYSLAHEIGHLLGARHDLSLDQTMTPFPYGHGYVHGVKWRDIMSYKESCGGCPRVPVWSSPHVLVDGDVAGSPDLDNARVIAEQAPRVAAFR